MRQFFAAAFRRPLRPSPLSSDNTMQPLFLSRNKSSSTIADNTFKATAQEALEGGVKYAPLLVVFLGISTALVAIGYELNKINDSGKLYEERIKLNEERIKSVDILNEERIKSVDILNEERVRAIEERVRATDELNKERSKSNQERIRSNEERTKSTEKLVLANEKQIKISTELAIEKSLRLSLENSLKYPAKKELK